MKMFPLQAGYRDAKSAPHPLQIPWSVAEKAYCAYARQYGTRQSLERLAERGGFDGAEMDMLYPAWREEVSELASLRAKLAEWEAAGRVLAAEWNAINHLASCGDHSNGVEGDSGTDEGDYRACCEMERSAKAISANPLASRLVAEAGGTQ